MSCMALGCFIETKEVSQHLHKTFHWLNGEGSYAHIIISSFSLVWLQGFKVSRLMVSVCVFLCVCTKRGTPGLPWQLCLNQVWHPHMSENNGILYVFEHVSVSQQAQMESDGWGGGQRCWNGNQATMRPFLWLTCSQASNIKQLKTSFLWFSAFVYLTVYGT